MNLETRVKQILVQTLELDIAPEDIGDQDVIFEGDLAADSIASLEIITQLEDEFGFMYSDDEIGAEMFASVATLIETVKVKLP